MKYVKLSDETRQAIIFLRYGSDRYASPSKIFMGFSAIARIVKVCYS